MKEWGLQCLILLVAEMNEKQRKGPSQMVHHKKTNKDMKINPPTIFKAILGLLGIPTQRF